MSKNILYLLLLLSSPTLFAQTTQKTIEPTWESMAENYQIPEWFQNGKIGVWMHWGVCLLYTSDAADE